MKKLKVINTSFIVIILTVISSCGGHLPADKYPNPSKHGYHRIEFDISKKGKIHKEIGIGNVYLKENQDLSKVFFRVYGLYKGTLYLKSDACGIDLSHRFNGVTTFNLGELIPYPIKCSISIIAETDRVKNRQHNIVETGVLKLNLLPESTKPVRIEYTRANSMVKSIYKTYSYLGQGSIQRQEGDLTNSEKFKIKTDLTEGGTYRVNGCGYMKSDSFEKDSFSISFKSLYKKNYLKREDSCDFEIMIIPNEVIETYEGRFSVNIYGKKVVKLEALQWRIKKRWGRKRIYVWGGDHILACSINNDIKTKSKHKKRYHPDKVYWIRAITTNARKSIFAIKNGEVMWKE